MPASTAFPTKSIGENIKRLRNERKITQETLASYLGVSCQAVSKWERGDTSPDIGMVIPIANFFEVSADELLNLAPARREQEILSCLRELEALRAQGETGQAQAKIRAAYLRFSDDFRIAQAYLDDLCEDASVENGYLTHREEIERVCRELLESCPTESVRYHAYDTLARLHYYEEQDAEVEETLAVFPSTFETRLQRLTTLYEPGSAQALTFGRRNFAELLEASVLQIEHIALEDPALNRIDQIALLKRAIALIESFLPDRDYGFFHYYLSDLCFWIANRHMMTGNRTAAMEYIERAFSHAGAYDKIPESFTYTSPMLRGVVFRREERGAAGTERKVQSQLYYLRNTCRKLYEPLFDTDGTIHKILQIYGN